MSGGSWDYLCFRMFDAADMLINEKCEYRRVFGKILDKYADAMKAIEWVDSGDCSTPHDIDAIKEALGVGWKVLVADVVVQDAKRTVKQLEKLIEKIEEENQN